MTKHEAERQIAAILKQLELDGGEFVATVTVMTVAEESFEMGHDGPSIRVVHIETIAPQWRQAP